MAHIEIPIKVNAYVDRGIAPLVEALNTYENAITLSACECDLDDGFAYVYFTVNGGSRELIAFAGCLSRMIARDRKAILSVEWSYGGDVPMARLRCSPDEVLNLARDITP